MEREVATGLGSGSAKIVLCGHRYALLQSLIGNQSLISYVPSMGGLLVADSLCEFVNTRADKKAPLWPKIIACIAFDTPVRKILLFGTTPKFTFSVSGYTSLCRQKHRK